MQHITIQPSQINHIPDIVKLITIAMTPDCCLHYAGPGRTIEDFAHVLQHLATMEQSQYSYRNTLVALTDENNVAGCCTAYDGARLHHLRQAFFHTMEQKLNRRFDTFDDETQPGEFYIDSLAVYPQFRRQGIATALLQATIKQAQTLNLPTALLVDQNNPHALSLYTSLGFLNTGQTHWGGHPMFHMIKPLQTTKH